MSYSASNARQDLAWLESVAAVAVWEQVERDPAVFEVAPAGGEPVRLSTREVRAFWRGVLAGRHVEPWPAGPLVVAE